MRIFAILALVVGLAAGCSSKTDEVKAKEEANKKALAQQAAAQEAAKDETAKAPGCSYTLTEFTPGWTAYKFTEKAPVSGTFNTVKISEMKTGDTLTSVFAGVTGEIEGPSVESNNPARNATIAAAFFGKFVDAAKITAKVTGATGDDKVGLLMVSVTMNGVTKALQMKHEGLKEDGTIVAKANIDMLDFALQAAFDSIHTTCKDLHTGKDGIAKTWTEVEVSIAAKVTKTCT